MRKAALSQLKHPLVLWTVFFLFFRFIFLTSLPIFNDEAMYLHWGMQFMEDASLWSTSLILDGKQPGLQFIFGFLQVLPFNSLVLGRVFSVVCGAVTFVTTLLVAKKLFGAQKLFPLAALLCLAPFLVFFERLALAEAAVASIYSCSLLLLLSLYKKPSVNKGIALGVLLAMGWWIKSTILLAFLPIALLTFLELRTVSVKTQEFRSLFKSIGICVITFLCAILPLFLNSNFHYIIDREKERVFSISEILRMPFGVWLSNFLTLLSWFSGYLTPLVAVLLLIGIYQCWKTKAGKTILIWFALPTIFEVFFSKVFTARYLLLVIPSSLIIVEKSFVVFKKESWKMLAQFTALVSAAIISLTLMVSPLTFYHYLQFVPLAQQDFGQYVKGNASGYGIREAVDWFHKQPNAGIIFVRKDSGNPEDAMYPLFRNTLQFKVLPITILAIPEDKEKIRNAYAMGAKLYFVSRGNQFAGLEKYMHERAIFRKPLDDEFVGVYEMGPQTQ